MDSNQRNLYRFAAILVFLLMICAIIRLQPRQASGPERELPPIDAFVEVPPAWRPPSQPTTASPEAHPVSTSVVRQRADVTVADVQHKMSSDLVRALEDPDPDATHRVIVQPPRDLDDRVAAVRSLRAHTEAGGLDTIMNLDFINATVLELRTDDLLALASREDVGRVSLDAIVRTSCIELPVQVTGADLAWLDSEVGDGVTGKGVTVAVVDSGVDRRHPDFKKGFFGSRVSEQTFVDRKGDDFGHGTHVAGIVAGAGTRYEQELGGDNAAIGVAPGAQILSLRVLDKEGKGYTSTLISAIAYATVFKEWFGIRVMNLSLGHPVYESYLTDPLSLACAVAVTRGIAIVCSAGNAGWSDGEKVYGSISSPGHAPWVITVGAANSQCTVDRSDDTIARFSSRGPTAIDGLVKPDLVAPGVRIVNCQPTGRDFITDHYDVGFSLGRTSDEYMTLNGTSMAAPAVAGTLALMFEANPSLTPNMAKAILMYTAEKMTEPSILEQGNGLVNAEGAVRLSRMMKKNHSLLPLGDFQLDAAGPDEARGMLLPFTNIAGRTVYWGAAYVYGDRTLWGEGNILGQDILWGNGRIWSDTILWTFGEPWYDALVANKTPSYADSVLFVHDGGASVVWSDTILWTFSEMPGVDPSAYVMSDTILWTYSDIHDEWSGQMAHPSSIQPASIGVLVEGENHEATGATFIDEGSPFYPQPR